MLGEWCVVLDQTQLGRLVQSVQDLVFDYNCELDSVVDQEVLSNYYDSLEGFDFELHENKKLDVIEIVVAS